MPSATSPTTVATGMRSPRMHGTPSIYLGLTVMRVNFMALSSKDSASKARLESHSTLTAARSIPRIAARNLAGIFLGFRIPIGTRTSNWAAPQLSAALESPTPPPTLGPAASCTCASGASDCYSCSGIGFSAESVIQPRAMR